MHCQYQINLLSACSDRDKSALIQIMSCDFYMHEVTLCFRCDRLRIDDSKGLSLHMSAILLKDIRVASWCETNIL